MKLIILITLLIPLILEAQTSFKRNKSIFEAGFGAVYASIPHYPGSSQTNTLFVPFPTVIYRGDMYRIDEDGGARTRFFYSDKMEINLSVGGSLPVSTKDSKIREGMPKLDTIGEVGPGFIYHFFNKRNAKGFRLSINIPVRLAVSSDLKFTKARGIVFNPLLYGFYDLSDNFSLIGGVSAYWGSKKYTSYLYDVGSQFVTPTRSQYSSNSGYVVSNISLALLHTRGDLSIFVGSVLNDAGQSANKDSPLFEQKVNWSHAIGFTYFFYEYL
tara:strand:+ start:383 stop:1195 length:813 start_codon:yes stop_codon:yes gene_type:complete